MKSGAASGRMSKRERREQVKIEILKQGLELSRERPFRELTIEQIAGAVGISRSAFYLHFRDKHDLLIALLGDVGDRMRSSATRMWTTEGAPSIRVGEAVESFVSFYEREAETLRIATEVSSYDEEVATAWRSAISAFIDATADHIRAEQRNGLMPPMLDPAPSAEALVWMAERCCSIQLAGGERTAIEVSESLSRVWLAALYPGVVPEAQLRPGISTYEAIWGVPPPEWGPEGGHDVPPDGD